MIVRLADNIISPLGSSSEGNFRSVREGLSALRRYDNHWGLPEPFVGSLFEDIALEDRFECDLTDVNLKEGVSPFSPKKKDYDLIFLKR